MRLREKERVKIHPATDAWMAGDRYGKVVKVGAMYVHVKCDRSKRVRRFVVRDVCRIAEDFYDVGVRA